MRFEVRKLEYYFDGTVNYADEENNTGDTCLGSVKVPRLSEINLDTKFNGKHISKVKFDELWFKCINLTNISL